MRITSVFDELKIDLKCQFSQVRKFASATIFYFGEEDEDRLRFCNVVGLQCRFAPTCSLPEQQIPREYLFPGGFTTLLELHETPWLKETVRAFSNVFEPVPFEVRHFVMPGDDYSWEILARRCEWWRVESEEPLVYPAM